MKLNALIKNRIALFMKSEYISQYESIMINMANSVQSKIKKSNKIQLFSYQTKRNKSYWNEMIKVLFNKETDDSFTLAIAYLKLKAKVVLKKLSLIASLFDIEKTQVIKQYFTLSRNEIETQMRMKKALEKENKTQETGIKKQSMDQRQQSQIFKKNKLRLIKSNHAKTLLTTIRQNEGDEEEPKVVQSNDIELEPQQRRMINIFVGIADFKKLMNNKQKIVMQKGKYCQTFIITDKEENNSNHRPCYRKPSFNSVISVRKQHKNNIPISFPLTCNNNSTTSKNKSIWFNQDLEIFLKLRNRNFNSQILNSVNKNINIRKLKMQNENDKDNCFFPFQIPFPSITPTSPTKTKLWQCDPRMKPNSPSSRPKCYSQTNGLTLLNKQTNNGNLIKYIRKADLYY